MTSERWQHTHDLILRENIKRFLLTMRHPTSDIFWCYIMKHDCFIVQTTKFYDDRAKHMCKVWPDGKVTRFNKDMGHITSQDSNFWSKFAQ